MRRRCPTRGKRTYRSYLLNERPAICNLHDESRSRLRVRNNCRYTTRRPTRYPVPRQIARTLKVFLQTAPSDTGVLMLAARQSFKTYPPSTRSTDPVM